MKTAYDNAPRIFSHRKVLFQQRKIVQWCEGGNRKFTILFYHGKIWEEFIHINTRFGTWTNTEVIETKEWVQHVYIFTIYIDIICCPRPNWTSTNYIAVWWIRNRPFHDLMSSLLLIKYAARVLDYITIPLASIFIYFITNFTWWSFNIIYLIISTRYYQTKKFMLWEF